MEPRARIEAYLADYAAAHAEVLPLSEASATDVIAAWRAKLHEVDRAHRLDPTASEPVLSFSSRCDYDPAVVTIRSVDVDDQTARARLEAPPFAILGGHIIEMDLVRLDGDWRIDTIRGFHQEPGSPLKDAAKVANLLESAGETGPFEDLGWRDNPDLDALFVTGRARVAVSVEELEEELAQDDEEWDEDEPDEDDGEWDEDEPDEALLAALVEARSEAEIVGTELVELGAFPHGGHLAVGDPGYGGDLHVCALAPEPGVATAQAVIARFGGDKRVAAVRALLGPSRPVRWQRALSVPGAGFVIGVDSGTAAIVDAAAYFSMSHREWAPASEACRSCDAALVNDASGPIGVITRSGWGDGGYGVFWGLDDDDRPAQLVIDYGILWEPVTATEGD